MAYAYFVLKGPERRDAVLVWDTRTLSVGRSRENALVLDDAEVSRKHALFTREGDQLLVGDYQTGNGTFVNGQRISGQQALRPSDVVEIGKYQMVFYVGDEHPSKLGLKVQFSSQLMTVGQMPGGGDPNATMLGLADALPAADDDFVIEHEGSERGVTLGVNEIPELELDVVAPSGDRPPLELEFDDPVLSPELPPEPTAPPAAAATTRPSAPGPGDSQSGGDPIERMRRLKSLLEEGLITQAEFERKRAAILDEV